MALFAQGNRTKPVQQTNRSSANQDAPGTQAPDVVPMVGPVILNQDLRKLPYVAAKEERDEQVLMRYPHGTQQTGTQPDNRVSGLAYVQQLLKSMWRPDAHNPGSDTDL